MDWTHDVDSHGPATARQSGFIDELARRFIDLVALLAAAAASVYALLPAAMIGAQRGGLVASCAVLALLALLVRGRSATVSAQGRVFGLALAVLAVVVANALLRDLGVQASVLSLLPLLVCCVAVLVERRAALALVLACAAAVVGLAVAELQGWTGSDPSAAVDPLSAATLLLALACAALGGDALAQAIGRAHAQAHSREQRFVGLLTVAADWYWEMDSSFRFTHFSQHAAGSSLAAPSRLGRTPWEIDGFGLDAMALDAHRADLESHQAFADLLLQRRDRQGRPHWYRVSGRPRFDERGAFAGYWGVGRDVTHEKAAEAASAATEGRYRELFARSPSPLVLHRDQKILDLNDAALVLLGAAQAVTLIGRSLLDFYDDSDGSRGLAAERARTLDRMPVGESMPARAFVLRSRRGRRVVAQVASVKVDTDGGPAILSIYQDDTERLRAEVARARSEALMTHLVATSPDLITLTDLATGRYVMVNDAFLHVTGWSRDEAVGKTADELGVWPDGQGRSAFVAEVGECGGVRDRAVEFVARDGRALSLMVSAARFRLEGRDYLVLNGRDVTQAERARLEREAILQNASIGIAVTRDRAFQMANPKFEQMFGWPAGGLAGQPGRAVWARDEDYAELGRELGPVLARGEAVEFERTMQRRDGSTFLCRLLARAVDPSHPSKGATIWIAEDVTERRAFDEALARARDGAEAANRAKSAFLANTSHEIRTPLNGLVGLARLARQPGLDPVRRERYLRQIDESARALSGVISDILDLSKIEAGKLRLERVTFDLHALLESIEHGYAALAEARALKLTMQVHAGVARRVCGDPARLRQVLSNFLSNALKFTDSGGVHIEVHALPHDTLRFEVRDTGCGIDPAIQSKLFTPFTQADESTTRRFGGTGLGLSICRELAELMQGRVGVSSEPGRGSRFWAELPLPASTEAAPASAFGDLVPVGAGGLAGMRVLIAEDNPVNMLIAVALVEQWGVQVAQAANGAQAIAAVDQQAAAGTPFDLVLMDVQMPEMGGYEATRKLRERHSAASLPIIALTAAALTSERDEALACGMNDFLTKPIDANRLHDTLLQWRGRVPSAAA